jgi:hypothetical protein
MFRWLSIALFAAAASVPFSAAQMRGAHSGFVQGSRGGFGAHRQSAAFARNRGMYWGSPFLYPDYDSGLPGANADDNSVENSEEVAASKFMIVRPALRPAQGDGQRKAKATPLLIEWRGDRYVRFGGVEQADGGGVSPHPDYAESKISVKPLPSESPAVEPPPAVLVYRDGHREEISEYAIANGIIYMQGNDWTNAARTRRIPLSALDSSATMQANQQRGVKFMLPSASNVVIASF